MYLIINLLIFVITLFLYIHIYAQINTSNYLEIYEINNVSKEKFEELCNLKQPLLINDFKILESINLDLLLDKYKEFDIKISKKDSENIYLPVKLESANKLFDVDTSNIYISDDNYDFLEETTLIKEFNTNDMFLRPYYVSYISYNIILGSINSYSRLKYSVNCRNYFYTLSGKAEVTLCSPNNYKYLHVENNYESLYFNSAIDLNRVDDIYKSDYSKVKFLRVIIDKNSLLQIPAYWFYSIKLLDKNTLVSNFSYRTYMNSLAVLPQMCLHLLQNNNIKFNTTKILDI